MMDIEGTKKYYQDATREKVCPCDYCQNFADEIKNAYPEVAKYLENLGVNIEIPFESGLPIEEDNETFLYTFVQYLIVGDSDGFKDTTIGDIEIYVTNSHPSAKYQGKYFIIETGKYHIKRRNDKYQFN